MWMSVLFVVLPIALGAGVQAPHGGLCESMRGLSFASGLDAIRDHPRRPMGDVKTRVVPRRLREMSWRRREDV